MAVAVTILARDVTSVKRLITRLAFSGTYTTGGEQPAGGFLKALAMSRIHMVVFSQDDNSATSGLVAKYDRAADKVMLQETAAAVDNPLKEVTSAQSLTGVTVNAEFIGEGNN